jgi:hypothetical protein
MRHELKTWPGPFQAIVDGSKRFELHKDDRGFAVGDTLWLRASVLPAIRTTPAPPLVHVVLAALRRRGQQP